MMSVPFVMGRIIDLIYKQSDSKDEMKDNLTRVCSVLLIVFLVGGAANFGRVYLMNISGRTLVYCYNIQRHVYRIFLFNCFIATSICFLGNRIIKRLRENVFSSIIKQEMAFFDKNKTGELINR